MNRERAKELLTVIEAFANGEDVEYRAHIHDGWRKVHNLHVDCEVNEYQIKPPEPREWTLEEGSIDAPDTLIAFPLGAEYGYIHAIGIKVREVL